MPPNQNPVLHPTKQQGGQATKQSCDVKVTIGRVVRGNPYVDRDAKPLKGLPDSVPPGKTYQVEIKVSPPMNGACPQDFIEVSIVGGSDDNGTATVSPEKITKTTTVTVTGGAQTKPKNGGKLKIQAAFGKKVLAVSPGFTVCAHPLNFADIFESNIDETLQGKHVIGMKVRDSWEADSGEAAFNSTIRSLNKVMIKELVLEPPPKEPPFHAYPGDRSGYNLGIIFSIDRHAILYPDRGPEATWVKSQLSVYQCERCGCSEIVMPNSGLQIKFQVINDKGWKFFVEKVGARVTVSALTSEAGNAKVKTDPVLLAEK